MFLYIFLNFWLLGFMNLVLGKEQSLTNYKEDEVSDEKSFQYVKIMLPLFRAVVKFCSTNRLLKKTLYPGLMLSSSVLYALEEVDI